MTPLPTGSVSSLDVEGENEDVLDVDFSSQYSNIISQDDKQLYTAQD